ncbi:MAG: peptidyl-prolyl cis-trans isomerase [Thermoanaerobaculum sp.]|nr:peptidyl-prolyl cis-trans isomerase [Thermoanaerobaculum sp.]
MKKLFAVAALSFFAGGTQAQTALKVNGSEITKAQVALAKSALMSRMGLQPGMVDENALTKSAVEQLIAMELLAQAAREAKITVDQAQIKASLEQEKSRMGGQQNFDAALKAAGLTEAELARMEEQQLLIRAYIEKEITPKSTPTPAEVESYYKEHPEEFKHEEQVKLQMILAMFPQGADEKAKASTKAKAEAAATRVAKGEEFAKVAAEVSDDPSKARGGEIGWVRKGMLLPELEGPVFQLQPGGVSKVLESQFGYHVFRVADRRPAGTYPFEEVKDNLARMLAQRKSGEILQKQVEERRTRAKIEPVDPEVKAALGAAPKDPREGGKP